jgi:nucleoside-diphosphate-sugar epimerase
MNIVLVGGTGVLSSAVASEALKKGIAVTMINRGNSTIPNGVEHIKSDKDDLRGISAKLEGRKFDAIMDFLCYTDAQTEKSVSFYTKYTKQYFYISSCAVYNTEALAGKEGNEESPKVLPVWKYSVDKWKSEELIMSLFKNSDTKYTIIRPCVTYGSTRIPYGISPMYGYHWTLCARILANKPIIRWNGGINKCNMTRVEDFAVGVVGLIGNPMAYNEVFNVCGDETPTFNEVLDTLSELLNHKIITVDVTSEFYASEIPSRAGEILGGRSIDSLNSNKKLKNIVPDFKQTIGLKDGIAMTLNAYKQQNYENGIDWKFDADTDRIVKKWCKKNNLQYKKYNLGFSNYLGTATFKDKVIYWLEYNKESIFIKCINYGINTVKKACRIFHKKT